MHTKTKCRAHFLAALAGLGVFAGPGKDGQANPPKPRGQVRLTGFASLPADTFASGPSAGADRGDGQPISANGRTGPFPGQPVQGFSGVQFAPGRAGQTGSFWFLSDNGFGNQTNSADYLLRIYQIRPRFTTRRVGPEGEVTIEGFVSLSDPDRKIPFPIVREGTSDRLLTGADFDIESFVIDKAGDLWVGDEFGPFILHFDPTGRLLEAPIPTPDITASGNLSSVAFVRAPQNPFLTRPEDANLATSRGYEGMAFSPDRRTLYPLLEGAVQSDPADALRIYELDAASGHFVSFVGFYRTDVPGHAIGDFTPVNETEFLVIERDGGQGPTAAFKKVFQIDISKVDANGYVKKTEIVDLLDIRDPRDLNRDGGTLFTFPFVTIEDVVVLDKRTILVANDNNYPFSLGRGPDIDNNEIIRLRLPHKLDLDPRLGRPKRGPDKRGKWNGDEKDDDGYLDDR